MTRGEGLGQRSSWVKRGRLCERERVADLRELMVHQRKVLRYRVPLPDVVTTRTAHVRATRWITQGCCSAHLKSRVPAASASAPPRG